MSLSDPTRTYVSELADLASLAGTWTLDPADSTVEFTGRHFLFLPVNGSLPVHSGHAELDTAGALTRLDATVGVAGFTTGNLRRDQAVRGAQFLDAGRFPTLHYSGEVVDGVERLSLSGSLLVKDREVPMTLGFDEVAVTEDRVVVRATAEVDRHACGVSAMRGMVGPKVVVRVCAVFIRQR